MADDGAIRVHHEDGIATLTLSRPEKHNALTYDHFNRLGAELDSAARNPDVRVVILTGQGAAFCAGADLSSSDATSERISQGSAARVQVLREITAAARSLHRIAKPTIAAVNGVAAGAGCNLAIGCDIVFAGESARFSEIFVNRGLSLDYGGTWLLPRLVGLQRAKDIAFRGDVLDAKQAERMGLVLEVVPDAALAERARDYARTLAAKPPIALSLIKAGLNRSSTWGFDEGLEYEADAQAACLGSEDFREAMRAWLKKRPGQYEGK